MNIFMTSIFTKTCVTNFVALDIIFNRYQHDNQLMSSTHILSQYRKLSSYHEEPFQIQPSF